MRFIALLILALVLTSSLTEACELQVSDRDGDGEISLIALGDSITFGIGDGGYPPGDVPPNPTTPTGGGYPERVESITGLIVQNRGVPGEELVSGGVFRLPGVLSSTPSDGVILLEGSNDAVRQVSTADYRYALQRAVNVSRAMSRDIVIATLPRPCCEHESLAPFTASYSQVVRDVAFRNDIPVVDGELAWNTTCKNEIACELLNRPEGLHPNSLGYDVLAETVSAGLFDVEIFAESGAADLEECFGLPSQSVLVKPLEQG